MRCYSQTDGRTKTEFQMTLLYVKIYILMILVVEYCSNCSVLDIFGFFCNKDLSQSNKIVRSRMQCLKKYFEGLCEPVKRSHIYVIFHMMNSISWANSGFPVYMIEQRDLNVIEDHLAVDVWAHLLLEKLLCENYNCRQTNRSKEVTWVSLNPAAAEPERVAYRFSIHILWVLFDFGFSDSHPKHCLCIKGNKILPD